MDKTFPVLQKPLRFLLYALALLPLFALEALLPLPLLPLAVAAAALSGPEDGARLGLLAGFLYGLGQPEPLALPLFTLALCLLGALCGGLRPYLPGLFGAFLLALLLLLALQFPRTLWWMLARGTESGAAFLPLGRELLGGIAAFPAVYALYALCRRATDHLVDRQG